MVAVRAVVGWSVRVILVVVVVRAVMVLAVVVVIVVPNVNSIATVLVAPFDLCLEMWPLSVFVAFNGVVRVASSVAKVPSVRVWNASISVVGFHTKKNRDTAHGDGHSCQ